MRTNRYKRMIEIQERMEALADEFTSEEGHRKADDLLVEAINLVGTPQLKALVADYENVGKWYA